MAFCRTRLRRLSAFKFGPGCVDALAERAAQLGPSGLLVCGERGTASLAASRLQRAMRRRGVDLVPVSVRGIALDERKAEEAASLIRRVGLRFVVACGDAQVLGGARAIAHMEATGSALASLEWGEGASAAPDVKPVLALHACASAPGSMSPSTLAVLASDGLVPLDVSGAPVDMAALDCDVPFTAESKGRGGRRESPLAPLQTAADAWATVGRSAEMLLLSQLLEAPDEVLSADTAASVGRVVSALGADGVPGSLAERIGSLAYGEGATSAQACGGLAGAALREGIAQLQGSAASPSDTRLGLQAAAALCGAAEAVHREGFGGGGARLRPALQQLLACSLLQAMDSTVLVNEAKGASSDAFDRRVRNLTLSALEAVAMPAVLQHYARAAALQLSTDGEVFTDAGAGPAAPLLGLVADGVAQVTPEVGEVIKSCLDDPGFTTAVATDFAARAGAYYEAAPKPLQATHSTAIALLAALQDTL